ncbi:MAG: hypothetical protein ACRDXE_07265, partial [Acidimicrobiales bacterium]
MYENAGLSVRIHRNTHYEGVERTEKRSSVHRYGFDASQEHKLSAGQQVVNPAAEREKLLNETKVAGPGALVDVDYT